jgi:RNA polymerase sigma factor (sigma-70 family)
MPDHSNQRRHEALFAEHHAAVWRYAVRRVGEAAADDVVAETFLVAWRRIDSIPPYEREWLFAVARKVVANQRRGERRRAELSTRLAHERAGADDEPARETQGVRAALATLPERDQEALRLVYWEGLEPAQAARALGCSAVAMRVRLHRARARLARKLDANSTRPSPKDPSCQPSSIPNR